MELGEWARATTEKLRLEEKQRQTRRAKAERGVPHKVLWFERSEPGGKDLVKLVGGQGAGACTQGRV